MSAALDLPDLSNVDLSDSPQPARFALCRTVGKPSDWDDHIEGEKKGERERRRAKAAAVCARCPVFDWCRDRRNPDDVGIWAGELWLRGQRAAVSKRAKIDTTRRRPRPQPAPCGTRGGYRLHRKRNEPACEPCREANRERRRLDYIATRAKRTSR